MKKYNLRYLTYAAGTFALGGAIRVLARKAWHATTQENPPENIAAPNVKKSSAIAWALGLSVITAAFKLIFRSFFPEAHQAVHGQESKDITALENDQ